MLNILRVALWIVLLPCSDPAFHILKIRKIFFHRKNYYFGTNIEICEYFTINVLTLKNQDFENTSNTIVY